MLSSIKLLLNHYSDNLQAVYDTMLDWIHCKLESEREIGRGGQGQADEDDIFHRTAASSDLFSVVKGCTMQHAKRLRFYPCHRGNIVLFVLCARIDGTASHHILEP